MKVLNILIRRCVLIARFEDTVSFYENLIAQKARLRFDYPEYDLKLAQVGSVLLIGGTEQSGSVSRHRGHFHGKRHYRTGETSAFHRGNDYQLVKAVPTGWNMLVRHPDGMVAEYVEHHDKTRRMRSSDASRPDGRTRHQSAILPEK